MKSALSMVVVFAMVGASAAGCALSDDQGQTASELTATTNASAFVLTVITETAPQDKVVVTSSDGSPPRDCFGGCNFAYLAGSTVTTRVPFPTDKPNCIRFDGWSGDCVGSANTCSTVLDRDKTVVANWAPIIGCDPK